jgi:hypothetical protein
MALACQTKPYNFFTFLRRVVMTANVGSLDRTMRLIVGIALVLLGVFGVFTGIVAVIGYVVAAIALLTGLMNYCPLWAVCKINTVKKAQQKTV